MENLDQATVDGFGAEWTRFDQVDLDAKEAQDIFESYFSIFPWDVLPAGAEGFDMGCGSGRWARFVAQRVGKLHCVDPSDAIYIAARNLSDLNNVEYHKEDASGFSVSPDSQDFGYSLGVLHHVPNTEAALRDCVAKLKPGALFLAYLYYALENRPRWFQLVWRVSDRVRSRVAVMDDERKAKVADAVAATIYFPLARLAFFLEKAGFCVSSVPLSTYRDKSFYVMRTDALDRFGTRLEHRFTRGQIAAMMTAAGLADIRFSEREPYWVAVGRRMR